MPVCSSRTCGCALTSTSIAVSGSGSPGDPWNLTGSMRPQIGTRLQRTNLTAPDLIEGLMWWETDTRMMWVYSTSTAGWIPLSPRLVVQGTQSVYSALNGGVLILGGINSITTNATGDASISFSSFSGGASVFFGNSPAVSIQVSDAVARFAVVTSTVPIGTTLDFRIYGTGFAAVANTSMEVCWMAIGLATVP